VQGTHWDGLRAAVMSGRRGSTVRLRASMQHECDQRDDRWWEAVKCVRHPSKRTGVAMVQLREISEGATVS
jgi:hypothetical protein